LSGSSQNSVAASVVQQVARMVESPKRFELDAARRCDVAIRADCSIRCDSDAFSSG